MMKRMMMMCLLVACVASDALAEAIATSFVDVVTEGVPLGTAWRVESREHQSLVLRNNGGAPVHVRVQVQIPDERELQGHARALPSTDWIRIEPNEFDLVPQEERDCQVTIEVPDERKFRKRWYQAVILSKATPLERQGISIGAGLRSRLRFKTGSNR